MAKTFKEIREETKAANQKTMEEHRRKKQEINEKYATPKQNVNPDAPVKRFKASDVLVMGLSLWLAIPLLIIIFIVGLLAVVGAWDWIVGLFN